MNSYPHLFSPLTIRGKTYKNRLIAAPSRRRPGWGRTWRRAGWRRTRRRTGLGRVGDRNAAVLAAAAADIAVIHTTPPSL